MSGRKRLAPLPRTRASSDENGRSRVTFHSMLASPLAHELPNALMRAARAAARHLAIMPTTVASWLHHTLRARDEATRSRVADCNHLIASTFACAVGLRFRVIDAAMIRSASRHH